MKKIIPLHSLVLLIGPSGAGKSTIADAKFEEYEIISSDKIKEELTGDFRRQDVNYIVNDEIIRRIHNKLRLGERAVVETNVLNDFDRKKITDIGILYGVPIFYIVYDRSLDEKISTGDWRNNITNLIRKQDFIFKKNEKIILRGDGISTVIDCRKEDFSVVNKIYPEDNILSVIKKRGYNGIMVIADIHGVSESLKSAIEWAYSRNLFMLFLGDVVDYGPNSIECVNIIHDLIIRGKAIFTIGNHENKIDRWFFQTNQGHVRLNLSPGNKATTDKVNMLEPRSRKIFETKFKAMFHLGRHHWNIGSFMFAHASIHPDMAENNMSRLSGDIHTRAIYGQIDKNTNNDDSYPTRLYDWLDIVPKGKTVIVGHDIRSYEMPYIEKNMNGDTIVFLDTGSGKGGKLSAAHLIFTENDDLKIQAFTTH